MRVRIVSYEDVNAWILGKFARRLNEELLKLGIQSDIGNNVDKQADINHHIIYLNYDELNATASDTLMVTHIDSVIKLNLLKKQLAVAKVGVCMSKSTVDELVTSGIPADRLCYISPAHDGVIVPKKYNVGITSRVYPDGCKREDMLVSLSEKISPEDFKFTIMGMGWDNIVDGLRKKGFEVLYYSDFDYNEYVKLIPSLDYYLYLGMDEGSMGFIDALAAGVKTIVTPQGYHLDAPNGLVHPFTEIDELVNIFNSLASERRTIINSVATWTWRDYAIKHVELWRHILEPEKPLDSKYQDGVISLNNSSGISREAHTKYMRNLYTGSVTRAYKSLRSKDFKGLSDTMKRFLNRLIGLKSILFIAVLLTDARI